MSSISRREFLKISGLTAAMVALSACKPRLLSPLPDSPTPTYPVLSVPLTPVPTLSPTMSAQANGISAKESEIALLLRRITFGLRPEEYDHAVQLGFDQCIDEQLDYLKITDSDLDHRLSGLSTLSMAPAEMVNLTQKSQPGLELTQAALLRAVYSKRQLFELIVDFWTNHFNIFIGKNTDAYLKPIDDREVIRKYALGNFHNLLSASAHSPAMLVYLDNDVSTKNQPNENYARELMELHTLAVDGGYTQQDVHEVARALTGWTSGGRGKNFGSFFFNPTNHDTTQKVILAITFPAGMGIEDGEKVIDLLAHHPSTAHFIATKLVRRFVADQPPAALVDRAAGSFTQSGGDISKVLATILHSIEFKASLGQKLKRPFEWVVSALRALNVNTQMDRQTLGIMNLLGQPLFRWPSPDGFPDNAADWTTTTGLLGRWNFALALAFNTLKDSPVDLPGLLGTTGDPQAWIAALTQRILGGPVSSQAADILIGFVRNADTRIALPGVAALLLSSPFFQYR